MKLFSRKPQPIVQPEPETVKTVDPVYHCCNCNAVTGFEHRFVNGDLYLKRLQFNFLCDTCHEQREQARTKHNVANKSTVLETPAIPKRRKAMNGGVVDIGLAGKDSGVEMCAPGLNAATVKWEA